MESVDTVIIGGGQAGLATSYHLKARDIDHIVVERASRAGDAWRNGRWDSFTLVTPNWTFRLPGGEYDGDEPDGFMGRDAIVSTFERYVARFDLPVRFGADVTSVDRQPDGESYLVTTHDAAYRARNVVMATGPFQAPRVPAFSAELPGDILQLHSSQYRNPGGLPEGAVLVVGSAQSGCQIAEELYQSGRIVYLCVGGAGRLPRRYRGRDIVDWMYRFGMFDKTVDTLPSPRAKFEANPHLSGRDGGHSLNLHRFARDGVVLLGHLRGASGATLGLEQDLHASLAKADAFEAGMVHAIDSLISAAGIEAPEEQLPQLSDAYAAEEVGELDMRAAGITTVIWALGYTFDYSMVRLPVFDDDGYPIQKRGVTAYPGLYFMGLPYMYRRKSALLLGVGEDAAYVADRIGTPDMNRA